MCIRKSNVGLVNQRGSQCGIETAAEAMHIRAYQYQ